MSRILSRPMFRKGGSAGEGITSGLAPRQGYDAGKWVKQVLPTEEEISTLQKMYGPRPRSTNLNDFLISFGLDLASRSPQGNIFQTAAAAAKEPFAQFQQTAAGDRAFDDKLALGAYDIVKGEQEAEKKFQQDKELIAYEAELNPKLKKVFREEIPEVRINNYAASLQDSDLDFIATNSMEIAEDIVTFNVFKEKNPDSSPAKKNFRGILPYKTDYKTGEVLPNYESIQKGQIFYNPEDGLFYERINNEGLKTDFKELDPFTYD